MNTMQKHRKTHKHRKTSTTNQFIGNLRARAARKHIQTNDFLDSHQIAPDSLFLIWSKKRKQDKEQLQAIKENSHETC